MSGKDFAVGTINQVSVGGQLSKKPSYLIVLDKGIKKHFIAVDNPNYQQGFIQVKGFFSNSSEDEIINNISEILTELKRELICEMMFPWEKILYVRSLVFSAVKASTLVVK